MVFSFSQLWHNLLQRIGRLGNQEALGKLGDFTTTPRVVLLSLFAIVIGALGAVVALALLRLIGLFTNLFFFQRWGTALVSPAGNHLGPLEIFVPIIGALIIGVMARYGSERIRGHGIPEALESILINGSKIEPRVALLKPLSSAISIGSGGPFGAEGPIIMTGGAFGSMIAQFFRLSSAERKTLLVAGAAAGMSATFAAPVASVLLAVEVLLFEWKPRSLIPVALASVTADVLRRYLIGMGPLFPVVPHPAFIGPLNILACMLLGALVGVLSSLLTMAVYASEDAFRRLPIHWMWWPAIGGLVIGLGGLIYPQALGVGYDMIGALLQGQYTLQLLIGLLLVKSIIWSVSLGSGTSGGVLAPLLMMGGALGGLASFFLPNLGPGFWPMVAMGAVLGGTLRSPLTGVIFMLELTHDVNMLMPLLVTVMVAYAFTVLVMRRSILTEKVSRRGYHLSSEYAVDPLEIIFVREVMRTNIAALPDTLTQRDLARILHGGDNASTEHLQRLYPILDAEGALQGVMTRKDLLHLQRELGGTDDGSRQAQSAVLATAVNELAKKDGNHVEGQPVGSGEQAPPLQLRHLNPVVAYPDEPLRVAVYRMAETGFTRLPVVERSNPKKLVGMVSLNDLLKARARSLEEERHRERVLRLRVLFRPHSKEKVEKLSPPSSEPD
jgi:CIC family chloride channel protein